jgi:signal transduction histidine kinase
MNQILRDTLTLLEHQFKASRITVQAVYAAQLPLLYGNQGKMQQVLLNLFLNAREAMQDTASRNLTITTGASDSTVFVEIADSGSGMDSEVVKRIYDPFFTTKGNPREGERKGTGLGLAVSYGIMQEHAGKIHVDSEIGRGTTFRLEFPAAGMRHTATPTDPTLGKPVHA